MADAQPTDRFSLAMESRWLRILVGAVVVIVGVALIAPYFLDVDRYRPELAALISQQTGRQITLGKIRAKFLPSVGFSVDGFHMSNPPDFAPGEFVAAAEIRGTVEFWPVVLHHELRITSLELLHAKLVLLEDLHGRNNFTFSTVSVSSSHTERESEPGTFLKAGFSTMADDKGPDAGLRIEPGTSFLQIDQLTLRDAEVVYGRVDEQRRVGATVDATGFDADLRHVALDPIRLRDWQAVARLSGARLVLAGWNEPINFRSGNATLRNNDLESAFWVDLGKAARVDGAVSVPDVEHAVVKFNVRTDNLDVDALEAGAAVKRSVVLPAPAATGLASRGLPLAKSQGAVTVSVGSSASSTSVSAGSGSELVAQGHVAAQRIRAGAHVGGPATADVRLYTDRMEIWPITIRFDGGSLQASARTDRRQTPQRFSVNLEARNLNISQIVVGSSTLQKKFAGTGELDLQVFGSLDDTWKKSLTGKGEFAIRNGRISGINLSGLAQSVAKFAGLGGDTTFTAVTGDVDIGHERIDSRDIHLDSPRGTLDLRGTYGFDGTLAYDGQLVTTLSQAAPPSGSGSAGGLFGNLLGSVLGKNSKIAVPFALRGTIQHPHLLPGHGNIDFSPAGQSAVQATQPGQAPASGDQNAAPFPNLFHK